jgi:hypothetical protein
MLRTRLAFALVALVLCQCSDLSQLESTLGRTGNATAATRPIPPRIQVSDVHLAQAPSNSALAAYYCAQVAGPIVCGLIGPVPSRDQLAFVFDVELDVHNDNAIPLPMAQVLAAFTAYPQATGQRNLGAACLTLCDQAVTCPQNGPDACRARDGDIRTLDDFAGATANFLVALAQGREQIDNLRVRTIAPNGDTHASIRLSLDPDVAAQLVRTMSEDAIQQAEQGRVPQFAVPYRFEGTAWIDVEHFGRIAVSIPPYNGVWNLR